MQGVKGIWLKRFLAMLLCFLFLGHSFCALTPPAALADAPYSLEITGDGVANPKTFSQAELEGMEQYEHRYSVINTWPTKKFYYGKGVKLRTLLEMTRIKEEAQVIRLISRDSFAMTLTVKELLEDPRYCFPYFKEDSNADGDGNNYGRSDGAEAVEPIIALLSVEGSDEPTYMRDMHSPIPLYGQRSVTEQTNNGFVKYLAKIEVLTSDPEIWDTPQANPGGGEVPAGTYVTLTNINMDDDKVYYTTDGSTPTVDSKIYNWIAKRWWGARMKDLSSYNVPIRIDKDTTIKAVTIGPGKRDSEVATFTYRVDSSGTIPERLAGTDRFDTAIAVADQGWSAGAENIVLANANSFADALAAGPLAYQLNAPILLTEADELTPSTLVEIQKLAPKKITLIGGAAVISEKVQDVLTAAYGADNVVRYAGMDRYETAAEIAAALETNGRAVLANGEDGHYQDALAISSYASYHGIPILFTEAAALPEATAKAFTARDVTETIVVGGEAVVPASIYDNLPSPARYSGLDSYATAAAIATGLEHNLGQVYVVTGLDFSDALVAGNLAAKTISPLLMVDREIPEPTRTFLTNNKTEILNLTVIGGQAIITTEQDSALRETLR